MAVYYVASKLSIVACSTSCIALRRRRKCANNSGKSPNDEDTKNCGDNWRSKELINMGFSSSVDTICGNTRHFPESLCQAGTEIEKAADNNVQKETVEKPRVITVRNDGIVLDIYGEIISGPLESFINLLAPHQNFMEIDHGFIFSFLLSSRVFIPPHELLEKLIEAVPENDESLDQLVALMKNWTYWFPYDFRGEEIMSLVKHIVLRCSANKQLGDAMSDLLSALLIKLDELSRHENEMKAYKRPLTEPIKEWPSSSKLAQLLCHVEKKFAKYIGPEEFIQCSTNLIKDETGYDVPPPHPLQATTSNLASSAASSSSASTNADASQKKKTCNLESYFEWSNRLRLLVANDILQCIDECDRSRKIEMWSSVAQHCLLVGNYNSATSILQPICRLQAIWKKILSATNRQQLDCLLNHIENSQNLNLWNKQTEKSSSGNQFVKKPRKILNSPPSPPPRNLTESSSSSIIRTQPSAADSSSTTKGNKGGSKLEWVVQPVFVDIVKLALKVRTDCCTRLPNGCIDFVAFNKLSAIVSAFTMHMSNVPINPMNYEAMEEYNGIVNHIFTCPLTPENELYIEFARNATKKESYYDVP